MAKDFSPEARAAAIAARKIITWKPATAKSIAKYEARNRSPRDLSVDEIEEIRLQARINQSGSSLR
jgi:hypothetical protein